MHMRTAHSAPWRQRTCGLTSSRSPIMGASMARAKPWSTGPPHESLSHLSKMTKVTAWHVAAPLRIIQDARNLLQLHAETTGHDLTDSPLTL